MTEKIWGNMKPPNDASQENDVEIILTEEIHFFYIYLQLYYIFF